MELPRQEKLRLRRIKRTKHTATIPQTAMPQRDLAVLRLTLPPMVRCGTVTVTITFPLELDALSPAQTEHLEDSNRQLNADRPFGSLPYSEHRRC